MADDMKQTYFVGATKILKAEVLVKGVHESLITFLHNNPEFDPVFHTQIIHNSKIQELTLEELETVRNKQIAPKDFRPGDLVYAMTQGAQGPVFVTRVTKKMIYIYHPELKTETRISKHKAVLLSEASKDRK